MQVWRHELPVDDQWHAFPADKALAVDSVLTGTVNFWSFSERPELERAREFRVFGTGHDLPEDVNRLMRYEGTCRDGLLRSLVWHVFSRPLQ